jgi:hypothetical protein
MDLIERYVAAIRRSLPKAKADDIAAELADELQTRREEREESLGRALTADETSAMLKEFGHPLVIAARYRPQQYLIGPDVFPFYLYVLKVVLAIGAALLGGLAIVGLVLRQNEIIRTGTEAVGDLWSFFFLAIAVVTLVFAVLERFGFPSDHLRKWTPETLPEPSDKPQSQWESALEVGLGIAFLLWWTGLVAIPDIAGTGGVRVEAAPVWDEFYLPILILASAQLAVNMLKWLRPRWKRVAGVLTIATSLATLAVIAGLQQAGTWVVVTRTSSLDSPGAARLGESVNLAIQITLVIVAVMMVLQVMGELWKLARGRARPIG